jgi:hypothetical protein
LYRPASGAGLGFGFRVGFHWEAGSAPPSAGASGKNRANPGEAPG